jgi:hypothetical protein
MGAHVTIPGSCLCGAVRFELSEAPDSAGYCHCTRCQKRTGSGASAQARVAPGAFRWVAGEEHVRVWNPPDNGWAKGFCEICGSHLFSRPQDEDLPRSIRMSAFDTDPGVRPSYRQFLDYAVAWEPVPDDGLEHHGESRGGHK